MRRTPNKKMIGLFTLTGIVCFFGAIGIFLGDKLFVKDEDLLVMYFDESIKGLTVGSPVVLQGVEIGQVYKINLLADIKKLNFKIPVYVKIDTSQIIHVDDEGNTYKFGRQVNLADRLVAKGLRARLASRNLLTGQLMITLEMLPDMPATMKGDGKHKEIPTVLSSFGQLSKGLEDLPVRESIEKFNTLLEQTNKLMSEVNKANSGGEIASTINNLNKTIQDVGEAAQSLRNFSDYIERHPEALLKGKKGY